MPVYDYRCDHCAHSFSAVQSFKDEPLAACPSCGQRPRRLVSPPAIVFKGTGWYKTDSRAAPAARSGEGGAETKGPSGSGDQGDKDKGDKGKKESKDSSGPAGAAKPADGGGRTGEAAS